jgi:hypothetical protein
MDRLRYKLENAQEAGRNSGFAPKRTQRKLRAKTFAISGVGVKHNSVFRIVEEEFTHAE